MFSPDDELSDDEKWEEAVFQEESEELHHAIERNSIDAVEKFVDLHPKAKYAFNKYGESALTTALKSKTFRIYSFLRSKGFASCSDGDDLEILKSLDIYEKEELKIAHREFFKAFQNAHIIELTLKSQLAFGNDQKHFKKIQNWFEQLDTIPGITEMLKLAANDEKFKIIFDFNNESVSDMDPTQLYDDIIVSGRTIYNHSVTIVMIAAKGEEIQVLSSIAHELTHYATHSVFNNFGRPFFYNDKIREREFENIIEYCHFQRHVSRIIENVFSYEQKEFATELIARVPQLLAFYMRDLVKLAEIREKFKILFDYYNYYVLASIQREISLVKLKRMTADMNERFQVYETVKNLAKESNGKSFDELDPVLEKSENYFIQSNIPELSLAAIVGKLKFSGIKQIGASHIFITFSQFLKVKNLDLVKAAYFSSLEPKVMIIHSTKTDGSIEDYLEIFRRLNFDSRVILISSNDIALEGVKKIQMTFKWNSISTAMQEEVMNRKIQFQGKSIDLSEFESKICPLQELFTLSEVIELQNVNVYEQELFLTDFFVERTLSLPYNKTSKDLSVILNFAREEKLLIIAETAGWGKTTFAIHFAIEHRKMFPTTWTIFVELKQFKLTNPESKINPDFLGTKVLNLKDPTVLKFFMHLFKNKRTMFVFDGFDEINPEDSGFVIEMIKFIKESNNCSLVTTRTYLVTKLVENLGKSATNLMPFSEEDQRQFLRKVFKVRSRSESELLLKVHSTLAMFRGSPSSQNFLEVPMQLMLISEIFLDSTDVENFQLDMYSLYKKFVSRKFILFIEKGSLVEEDRESMPKNTLSQFYKHFQSIALMYSFPKEGKTIDTLYFEGNISRIGLLKDIGDGKLIFIHLSLQEFFVANYVLENIIFESYHEKLSNILFQVLIEEKFANIQKFINDGLNDGVEVNAQVVKTLSMKLENYKNHYYFQSFIRLHYSNLIAFILNSLDLNKEIKIQFLEYATDDISLVFKNFKTFDACWKCIERVYTIDDIKLTYFGRIDPKRNILFRAFNENASKSVLVFVIDTALKLLDKQEFTELLSFKDKNDMTLIEKALIDKDRDKNLDPSMFEVLWKAVEDKEIAFEEQKSLLLDSVARVSNRKIFEFNSKSVHAVSNAMKKFFVDDTSKVSEINYPFSKTTSVWMAAHADIKTFKNFWKIINKNLRPIDMILENSYEHADFMSESFRNKDTLVAAFVFEEVFKVMDPKEFQKVFKIFDAQHPFLIEFLELCSKNFVYEYWKKMLTFHHSNDTCDTLMHQVATSFTEKKSEIFMKIVFSYLSKTDFTKMLLTENLINQVPLQSSFKNSDPSTAYVFWKFYTETLSFLDLEKLVFKTKEDFFGSHDFSESANILKTIAYYRYGRDI